MKTRVSKEWDGQTRKLFGVKCEHCRKEFWAPRHVLNKGGGKFCSLLCHGTSRQIRVAEICAGCGEIFFRVPSKLRIGTQRKHGKLFCNRRCKEFAQTSRKVPEICPPHYGRSQSSRYYRQKALRWSVVKCCGCGYDKDRRMLDVHHIDGNRKNAALDNLQILCVWCHAVKTRRVSRPGLPRKALRRD